MLLGKLDAEIEMLNYFIMYLKPYIWICGVTLIKAEKNQFQLQHRQYLQGPQTEIRNYRMQLRGKEACFLYCKDANC